MRDVWNDEVIAEIADLMVYQSIRLPQHGRANVLAGVDYVMIDPRYATLQPDVNGPIVVSLGGSDPHDLTLRVVEALNGVARKVKVIIGPAFEGVVDWSDDSVTFIMSPDNLLEHLKGAALLIGSLGMTAYEAAAAGVPALLIGWSDDHVATATDLEDRGVCLNLGRWDEVLYGAVGVITGELLADKKQWQVMSTAGKALVDGRGVERVADRIMELIG